jgi:hypothetical protein
MKRLLLGVPLLVFATGCPSSNVSGCPTTSTPVGDFTLALTLQPSTPQCKVVLSLDGGPADGNVAATPTSQNATLCAGPDDAGVQQIYLAVENRTVTPPTPLVPDGSLAFSTTSSGVQQTVCNCAINIKEDITGFMIPSTPGNFTLSADGGLSPSIASISGSLVDSVSANAGVTGCLCNVPCNLTYSMSGTRR